MLVNLEANFLRYVFLPSNKAKKIQFEKLVNSSVNRYTIAQFSQLKY